ncbi:hypothetical protein ACOQFL_17495 [Actinopolyspora sp. H202]|uniref:hypothetical protein n=1 Tax=Actinopolyspora sp. H202 TaxID=1500456 RepID=UPI003EE77B74
MTSPREPMPGSMERHEVRPGVPRSEQRPASAPPGTPVTGTTPPAEPNEPDSAHADRPAGPGSASRAVGSAARFDLRAEFATAAVQSDPLALYSRLDRLLERFEHEWSRPPHRTRGWAEQPQNSGAALSGELDGSGAVAPARAEPVSGSLPLPHAVNSGEQRRHAAPERAPHQENSGSANGTFSGAIPLPGEQRHDAGQHAVPPAENEPESESPEAGQVAAEPPASAAAEPAHREESAPRHGESSEERQQPLGRHAGITGSLEAEGPTASPAPEREPVRSEREDDNPTRPLGSAADILGFSPEQAVPDESVVEIGTEGAEETADSGRHAPAVAVESPAALSGPLVEPESTVVSGPTGEAGGIARSEPLGPGADPPMEGGAVSPHPAEPAGSEAGTAPAEPGPVPEPHLPPPEARQPGPRGPMPPSPPPSERGGRPAGPASGPLPAPPSPGSLPPGSSPPGSRPLVEPPRGGNTPPGGQPPVRPPANPASGPFPVPQPPRQPMPPAPQGQPPQGQPRPAPAQPGRPPQPPPGNASAGPSSAPFPVPAAAQAVPEGTPATPSPPPSQQPPPQQPQPQQPQPQQPQPLAAVPEDRDVRSRASEPSAAPTAQPPRYEPRPDGGFGPMGSGGWSGSGNSNYTSKGKFQQDPAEQNGDERPRGNELRSGQGYNRDDDEEQPRFLVQADDLYGTDFGSDRLVAPPVIGEGPSGYPGF